MSKLPAFISGPLERWRERRGGPVIPAIRLSGVIGSLPLRGTGISLASLDRSLEALFAPKDAPAAVILINSPGGSPVQSSLVGQRIRALAEEKKRPVLAFVEDVAASGGYWLACAADEIFADPSSIVGSIGVVSSGFGFQDAIARLGIERRVHTAGTRKTLLDPFRPERPEDLELLKGVQADIHARFIAWVRARRGSRLNEAAEPLFEGTIWTGERALGMGLVDGLAEPRAIVRQRFGDKARLRFIGPRRGWLARRLRPEGAADLSGALTGSLLADALALVEERAHWQRFGL